MEGCVAQYKASPNFITRHWLETQCMYAFFLNDYWKRCLVTVEYLIHQSVVPTWPFSSNANDRRIAVMIEFHTHRYSEWNAHIINAVRFIGAYGNTSYEMTDTHTNYTYRWLGVKLHLRYIQGPRLLTLISVWISNHTPNKVWDEITYPFSNFIGCTIEVWECIHKFTTHFIMNVITYAFRE